MTELNVLALALIVRAITIISIAAGVVYLAANDKPGWGWLIVLGVLVGSTSYRYIAKVRG